MKKEKLTRQTNPLILVKVFRLLNRKKVRYLIAGGVAAILHGNPRFTKDLDLWVDVKEDNLRKLVETMKKLKFIPRIPIKAEEFISKENREKWFLEKGMLAFTFINPKNSFENIDILWKVDLSFDKAYKKKKMFPSDGINLPVISREDLIRMKQQAGRAQDLRDIDILNAAAKMQRKR